MQKMVLFVMAAAVMLTFFGCDLLGKPAARYDADGNRLVSLTINVGGGGGEANRALTTKLAKAGIDYYEVVFKDPNPNISDTYYRTNWTKSQSGRISLPTGNYGGATKAILFAGTANNKTLLAVGLLTEADGDGSDTVISYNTKTLVFTLAALETNITSNGTDTTFKITSPPLNVTPSGPLPTVLERDAGGSSYTVPVFMVPSDSSVTAQFGWNTSDGQFDRYQDGMYIPAGDAGTLQSAGVVSEEYGPVTVSPTGITPRVSLNNTLTAPVFDLSFETPPENGMARIFVSQPVYALFYEAGKSIQWHIRGGLNNDILDGGAALNSTGGSILLGVGAVNLINIITVPHNYLTITNLPTNLQQFTISDVFIWNQTGKVGQCANYNSLIITSGALSSSIRIPLSYSDPANVFAETGDYYVSFALDIDASTKIRVAQKDGVIVQFNQGNGTLNADTLPRELPTPYLTLAGLPVNTTKDDFSDIFLYDAVGKIGKCADYQEIIISTTASFATAMIPLAYENTEDYFRDSGQFIVTFMINVDSGTVILKTRNDSLSIPCTDGFGQYNLLDDRGYLSVGLVSYTNLSAPVVKTGTIFEMNGSYEVITADTPVAAASFSSTCVIYVYAQKTGEGLSFVYSDTAPSWNPAKIGYYNGNNRALFKMLYINDTTVKYAAKKDCSDSWDHYDHYTLDNLDMGNTTNQIYSLSGDSNPAPLYYIIKAAGWYVLHLTGGGGGGSGGVNGTGDRDRTGGVGGAGGQVAEVVYLPPTTLTVFTGSGGGGAGAITYGKYQGTGGGGGGSGSFIYSTSGYFLCAGGGSGGAGASANDGGGGGGGAGGSIGCGGYGGYGGGSSDGGKYNGSSGGRGGGYEGDKNPGYVSYSNWTQTGNAGYAFITATNYGFNGNGAPGNEGGLNGTNGGGAGYAEYTAPNDWKNTNNANGQGQNGTDKGNGKAGGTGGNNRNAIRGGGGAGGAGGTPSDSSASAGKAGSEGFVRIYRFY